MFLRGDSVILFTKMGEEMWTEPEGYSANNIAVRSKDTYTTMMTLENEPVDRFPQSGQSKVLPPTQIWEKDPNRRNLITRRTGARLPKAGHCGKGGR